MHKRMTVLLLSAITFMATITVAEKNPMVGGQEMYPSKNIVENAMNSADHTTLVVAVKAAGLVNTLGVLVRSRYLPQPTRLLANFRQAQLTLC
jgi:uncharacterized surface protein with fasciclin (FAS1) repeats